MANSYFCKALDLAVVAVDDAGVPAAVFAFSKTNCLDLNSTTSGLTIFE